MSIKFFRVEIEKLRAENEQLRADLAIQQGCCDGAASQDARVRQEREEHRAEVERLREALKKIACRAPYVADCPWTIAREALEDGR